MPDLQQNIDLTNQQIAEALSYGVPEEDIYNHLRQSADPHHMEIVKRYDMAQGASKFGAPPPSNAESGQKVNTDIVDWMSENPKTTIALGLLGTATAGALGTAAYKGVIEPWAAGKKEASILKAQAEAEPSAAVKVQQEQNAISNRKLDFEMQKMQNESALVDNLKPAQELSPFDAAKLEEQNLKNQKLQLAIDQLKAQEARNQANHEAKIAAAQAKQAAATKQANPAASMKESEVGMVAASEDAKLGKAVAADKEVQATRAAVPQVAAQAVPPSPTEVQLTPSPEVIAESVQPVTEQPTTKAPVVPRRTAQEAAVLKEESPFNKAYNQYSQRLGGMGAEAKSPLQVQSDAAWEDIYKNVFKDKMPTSQGGSPAKWDEAERLIRSQPDKYGDVIKHLDDAAEKYGKAYTSQKGLSSLGMLAGIAGAGLGALGAYSSYKHGKETGDWSNLGQIGVDTLAGSLIKGLRGAASIPYAFATHLGEAGMPRKQEESEIAKRFYEAKVGGGRGVAPPESYKR